MSGSSEAKHGLSLQTHWVTYKEGVLGKGGRGPRRGWRPYLAVVEMVVSGAAPVYRE